MAVQDLIACVTENDSRFSSLLTIFREMIVGLSNVHALLDTLGRLIMRHICCILACHVLAGVCVAQGTITSTKADGFNDGSRNKTLWRITESTNAVFVESAGQLHFLTENPVLALSKKTTWTLNYNYPVLNSDLIETVIKVRLPHLVPDTASESTEFFSGMGWQDGSGTRSLSFMVIDDKTGRRFRFMKISSGGGLYMDYPVPTADSSFELRMLYKRASHTVTFFWRLPGETAWTKLGTAQDLHALWDISGSFKLIPYVHAASYNMQLYWSDAVALDNFKTTTTSY
jgi:hypothetical protein